MVLIALTSPVRQEKSLSFVLRTFLPLLLPTLLLILISFSPPITACFHLLGSLCQMSLLSQRENERVSKYILPLSPVRFITS